MEALAKLAETNMKVSEAKNALFLLQENETKYLTSREKKALERIQKVFDDSSELIKQTTENYKGIDEILRTAREASSFLIEAQEKFAVILTDFEARDATWREIAAKREEEIANLLKRAKLDATIIANEKKNIEKENASIEIQKQKIADQWGEIDRELKRLKEKKV